MKAKNVTKGSGGLVFDLSFSKFDDVMRRVLSVKPEPKKARRAKAKKPPV
jgi:hypothetical protein